MSIKCPNCGKELPEGAKFCGGCGSKITASPVTCPNCGSQLRNGAKFCNVCGTAIKTVSAAPPEPKEPENPTMDELIPPVINDSTFAGQSGMTDAGGQSDFDVAEMPDGKPAPKPTPTPAPAPTPVQQTAQPQTAQTAQNITSNVSANMYAQYAQQRPAANPTPAANPQTAQPYSTGNQNYSPYPAQAQQPTAKKSSPIVPIILIILIVAVILVDVFVLFPDRIFGSDDDGSAENEVVTVVTDDLI